MPKSPAALVAELRRMVELHKEYLWSKALAEAADMIEKLAKEAE